MSSDCELATINVLAGGCEELKFLKAGASIKYAYRDPVDGKQHAAYMVVRRTMDLDNVQIYYLNDRRFITRCVTLNGRVSWSITLLHSDHESVKVQAELVTLQVVVKIN